MLGCNVIVSKVSPDLSQIAPFFCQVTTVRLSMDGVKGIA